MAKGFTIGHSLKQDELKIYGLLLSQEVQFSKLVQVLQGL